MKIFRNMPRAAEVAKQRAFEMRAAEERIQMRGRSQRQAKPNAKGGVWQVIEALLGRTEAAERIAAEAKEAAEKAARPGRAQAVQIIRRSE